MASPDFDFLGEHAATLGTLSEELRTLARSLPPDQATAAAWIDRVAGRLDAQAKDLRAEMDGGDKSSLGLVASLGKRRAGAAGAVLGWLANAAGEGIVGKVAESLLPVLNNLVPVVMANADDAVTFVVAAGFLSVAARNALDELPSSSLDVPPTVTGTLNVVEESDTAAGSALSLSASGTVHASGDVELKVTGPEPRIDATVRPEAIRVTAEVPPPTVGPDNPPNSIGPRATPSISPSGSDSALLTENGDRLVTENGDPIVLE